MAAKKGPAGQRSKVEAEEEGTREKVQLGGADTWPQADTSLCLAFSEFYLQYTCWPVFRHIPPEHAVGGEHSRHGGLPPIPVFCASSVPCLSFLTTSPWAHGGPLPSVPTPELTGTMFQDLVWLGQKFPGTQGAAL